MDTLSVLPSASAISMPPFTTENVDILWRNRSPSAGSFYGSNVLWNLNGPEYGGQAQILPSIADANWSVSAVADYDKDGASDYLWHRTTGETVWWLMNDKGDTIKSMKSLPTLSDSNWTIVGAVDQNGDKNIDILWRHTKTGSNVWWLMNGEKIISGLEIQSLGAPYLDWEIKGIGDLDHDGAIDIFWSHQPTGSMVWWLMNGTTNGKTLKSSIQISADPTGGRAEGIADFNNDGQFDIVFRNPTTGDNAIWIMDGNTVLDRYALTGIADLRWEIEALVPRRLESVPSLKSMAAPATIVNPTDQVPPIEKNTARFFEHDQLAPINSGNGTDQKSYLINITQSGILTANLTGLSEDADVRLIRDVNLNGILDSSDSTLALEWERGTKREALRKFIPAGKYFIEVKNTSDQVVQYSLSSNFVLATSDAQAFKIQVNFKAGTATLTTIAREAIVSAAAFWENAIVARSAITQFNNLSIDILGTAIADNTVLAYASPLVLPDQSDRTRVVITSGEATLNLNRYSTFNNDPSYLRGIMIHEFAHALGFGTLWQPIDFGVARGGKWGRTWTDATTATYSANSYAGYAYGSLLGTTGAVAVPISSDLSHWDENRFDTELLTPYAEASGITMPVSVLTLSALRDLGWRINLAAAQAYGLPSIAPAAILAKPEPITDPIAVLA
jgi:FG-GAP-like repeat